MLESSAAQAVRDPDESEPAPVTMEQDGIGSAFRALTIGCEARAGTDSMAGQQGVDFPRRRHEPVSITLARTD